MILGEWDEAEAKEDSLIPSLGPTQSHMELALEISNL